MTAETSNAREWVLVPREPTEAMISHGVEWEYSTISNGPAMARQLYVAMLAAAPQPPSAPVGVEWPLSLLRAEHWREVYIGHRCMRLEVTYDYATWERLMAEVESSLAQQPAAVDEGFVSRLAEALTDQDWDVDPDGDGSGIAQLRAAVVAAQHQEPKS